MLMNQCVDELPNGKKILKDIYLTQDNKGKLPAHNIKRLEDIQEMAEVLDKDTLDKIVFHKDEDDKYPFLKGSVDLEMFLKFYKDEPEKLRQYFLSKEDKL